MRKTGQMIWSQTLKNIGSIRFWAASALFAALCLMSTISYTDAQQHVISTIMELLWTDSWKSIALENLDFSSVSIMLHFNNSEWFECVIPFLFTFPAVSLFVEEYFSGNYYLTVSRCSCRTYAISKAIAAGITGTGVFLLGYVLFSAIVLFRFPALSAYSEEIFEQSLFLINADMTENLLIILRMILNMAVVAMAVSLLILILSMLIQDQYFLFGLPVLLVFLMDKIPIKLMDMEMYTLFAEGGQLWELLIPGSHIRMYSSFEYMTGFPYSCYFVIMVSFIVVLIWIFVHLIKRRITAYV